MYHLVSTSITVVDQNTHSQRVSHELNLFFRLYFWCAVMNRSCFQDSSTAWWSHASSCWSLFQEKWFWPVNTQVHVLYVWAIAVSESDTIFHQQISLISLLHPHLYDMHTSNSFHFANRLCIIKIKTFDWTHIFCCCCFSRNSCHNDSHVLNSRR